MNPLLIIFLIICVFVAPAPTIVGLLGYLVLGFWGAVLGIVIGFIIQSQE